MKSHFLKRLGDAASNILNNKYRAGGARLIKKSGLFDAQFTYGALDHIENPIKHYLNASKIGASVRKPMPGFHPGIYAEHIETGGVDPFVHYLSNGNPNGPWLWDVIDPSAGVSGEEDMYGEGDCALHIHLHYYKQVEVILETLSHINATPDLMISVTSREGENHVLATLKSSGILRADVRIVPNRGRDIGPFLTEFGKDLRHYKVIGHIHAKDSNLVNDRSVVNKWVDFLMQNMVAGLNPMADVILSRFACDAELGLVFPEDPHVIGWTQNRAAAESLACRMGISLPLPQQINFPVGTMFWARPDALAPLFDLNLSWEEYPPEPVGYDGTMLHAIERLIPLIVAHAGYNSAVTHVPRVCR
jgi:hypothetical protein